MDPLSIVLMAITGIKTLVSNPALGGGGLKQEKISALLGVFHDLLAGGEEAWEDLKAFAEEVKALAEAGQEPSKAQWQAWFDRDVAARAKLVQNKARIEAEIAAERAEAKEKADAAEVKKLADEAEAKRLADEEASKQVTDSIPPKKSKK